MMKRIVLLITIVITSVFFWTNLFESNPFHADSLGYYLYLPSTFIYHNLKNTNHLPKDKGIADHIYADLTDPTKDTTSKGYILNQYTYGVALMETPFFFIAHGYEKAKGLPANGYSDTYSALIKTGNLLYALLGLIILYYILRKYFTATQSAVGISIILLGTNLFWFTIYQAGMSHVHLFFLYTLLIWLTIRATETPKKLLFPAIGFTAGLITLIRPTDILCLLIPLLYNVYNKETLRTKILFIKNNGRNILALILAFILPVIPQLLYWKAITGSYIVYSYGNQSFNWLHPKIINGLFYFSNGWLPYSPLMIFAIIGIFLYKRINKWAWCIWAIFPLYVYVIYSWYCYNYINGFGSRPMIHLYPLLAIPLTAFIQLLSQQKMVVKSLFGVIVVFFIAVNISYSIQRDKGVLDSDESNMQFNVQMLFRDQLRYKDLVVKDVAEFQPDSNKLSRTATLLCENNADSMSDHYTRDTVNGSGYIYHVTPDSEFHVLSVIYNKEKFMDAKWFKCSGKFMYPSRPGYFKHLLVLSIDKKIWKGCTIENKIGNWKDDTPQDILLNYYDSGKWGYVYYFAAIPGGLKDGDEIKLLIWNIPKSDIYVDDLCLELYK